VSTVTGRDGELRRAMAWLEDIDGPHTVLVTGPPGIGKTTVVEALTAQATDHGFRVLSARAAQRESTLAFGGLTDLLDSIADAALDVLPGPQRSALRAAILREEIGDGRHDRRAVAAGSLRLLRALATETPVLLAIDDLQWVDEPTARVLDYVSRRLPDERVGVLASLRTDDSGHAQPVLMVDGQRDRTAVLALTPLDDTTMERLVSNVADAAGSRLTMRQRRRMVELAAGNPLFGRELARSRFAADDRRLPGTIRQLVEAHIDALPGDTRSLLLVAATLREPTVSLVASAGGVTIEQAHARLEAAAEAGVLAPLDEVRRLTFSHPLYRAGVQSATTATARRLAHQRAASVSSDDEERAAHLALAATTTDAGLAARLDRAARQALARGAPETATDLARHALRLTPDEDADEAYAREVTIAEFAFHAGEIASARRSLDVLVQRPAPPRLRARALRVLGELESHQDSHVDAIRRFSEALELDQSADTQGYLRAHLAYSTVSDGDFEGARRHGLAGLALVDKIRSSALRAVIYAVAAISGYLVGEPVDEDLVRRALIGEDATQQVTMGLKPSLIVGHLRLYTGRLSEAMDILSRARATVVAFGNESDLVVLSSTLAWAHCTAGDLAGARAYADEALAVVNRLDSVPGRCIASAYGAVPYAFSGDIQRAETLASEALDLAEITGFGTGRMWAAWALIVAALEADRPSRATPVVESLLKVVDQYGLATPVRVMALADAVEVLIRLNDRDRAAHYIAVLDEAATRTNTAWAQMQAHRCKAMLAAAGGDLGQAWLTVSEALRLTDKHELVLESARTHLVAGQIARRQRQRREALIHIEHALVTFTAAGALPWVALGEAELARTAPNQTDPLALTPTEARVARLAADGLTNRAVAAHLTISPKTVEANLARVYRKLGIHSRAELGATLGTAPSGHRELR
jgi:DNA-binding CsgD family transcriptional regulator